MFRIFALLWVLACSQAQAGERLMLWEAHGTQGTVYLFGSIHVCKASCFPLDASVTNRLAKSDAFVLELDPTRAEVQTSLFAAAIPPPGEHLQHKLSTRDWQALNRSLAALGLPSHTAASFRPWMLGLLISMQAAQQAGFDVSQGVDLWMLKRARELGKPVLELETVERQIAAASSGSEREQLDALRLLVEQQQSGSLPRMLEEMRQAWARGDSGRLETLLNEGTPAGSSITHELIDRRNAEMAKTLQAMLAPSVRKLFVVVGAGHLIGQQGIPARLARQGFKVRQLGKGE